MATKQQFHFHLNRSLQAAAYLLKKADGHEMAYIHLLKMLYIADREFLAEYGYPITGDKVVAMQYGPVLSRILSCIKGRHSMSGTWKNYIVTLSRYRKVKLLADPGTDDLSRASMAKLADVFERYGYLEPFQVVQLTHEFTEWTQCYQDSTSTQIPWQVILQAQGQEKMIRIAEEQIKLQNHCEALQGACQ